MKMHGPGNIKKEILFFAAAVNFPSAKRSERL
jgi:hypothetical protein